MDISLSSTGNTARRQPDRSAFLVVGAFGALTAALAGGIAVAGFGVDYVLAATACYAAIVGAVLLGLRRRPRPSLAPASWITLFRAVLVSLIAGLLALPVVLLPAAWGWIMAGVAGAALALDGVDGWVARRFDQATAFGARFDQELDAFFILVLAVLVWRLGQVDAWVLLIGALRYVLLLAGYAWPRLARPLPPSRRRKAVCGLQVGALFTALMPPVGPTLAGALAAVALAGLLYSFAADTIWLVRPAAREAGGPVAPS